MKTGLYFGSFNPIHNGHLAIANYLVDFTDINELWFVVSPQNPLKDKDVLAPDFHRLEMVRRAIPYNEDRFMVCDIEINMPKPSYTIDTLKALEKKYHDKEFYVILGSDSIETITQWKDYETILNCYKILVYPRKGSDIVTLANKYHFKIINAPLVDYSSSIVRQKINQGEDVRELIPDCVLEYISDFGLYQTK
jgi:nicotinate-nucleotide adenylyltransferase